MRAVRRVGERSGLPCALAVVLAVLLSALPIPGVVASAAAVSGAISVTGSRVQVQSVADPTQWVDPTTVYEGSTARLVLDVQNAERPTSADITVVLSGINRTVASVTRSVGSGAQTVTVPLDLSLGAWSASGIENVNPRLSVTMTYSVPDSGGAQALEIVTPAPLPSPSPTAGEPEVTTSGVVPEPSSPATPVSVPVTGGVLPVEHKVSLWTSLAAAPRGSLVTVTLRGAVRKGGASGSALAAMRAREQQIKRFLERAAKANDVRVRVVILPMLETRQGSDRPRIVTQFRWRTAGAAGAPSRATPRALAPRGLQQTTHELPIALAPRPTVLLHGLWSSASTWSSYAGFQSTRHSRWVARAVNTMNTGSALAPFSSVNSVDVNAEAAWSYIQGVRTELNAGEVDLVAHSLGGIITRRMLHGSHATDARTQIRSVVMMGTPNGGSNCAEIWSVPATQPLKPTTMTTFNTANPGYPGVASTLVYSTGRSSTCLASSTGDTVVPGWSAQAQPVNQLILAAGNDCTSRPSPFSCALDHTDMTSSADWFRKYVLANLALATAPDETSSSVIVPGPDGNGTVIASGSVAAVTPAVSVSQTHAVSLTGTEKLVVSVASDESDFVVSYSNPVVGATPSTISATLTKVDGEPVYQATIGPLASPATLSVTLSGTTTKGIGWTFTKLAN